LERALHGETVEVTYKGSAVKLVPAQRASKLARAKRQHALVGDPDSIIRSDARTMAEMEAAWREDWSEL
jgi:antitoxin (DNA-binding transcriptional repressor) of toxin-antitoxin stability system